jgi:cytochrome c5
MKILLFWAFLMIPTASFALEVTLLTASGSKSLKTWSDAALKTLAKGGGGISAQELIFEQSTRDLDLNVRADIDLVTIYGKRNRVARIPRFMIWRGNLKFDLSRSGELRSRANATPLLVPLDFFTVEGVERVELGRASTLYPSTKLLVRTNPAASRGEKLFTQSCMACHSLGQAPRIEATLLNETYLKGFKQGHKPTVGAALDARALRGLMAYREALASEKISVNSSK